MTPATGRILIVDDNENNLLFIGHALRDEGYAVVEAHDGMDALDRFEKYQPDLVVTDLLMPQLSGFVVCQRLKQNERTRAIPIIAMSGLTDHSDKVRALEVGADCFLYKPIDNMELLLAVRTLLQAHRSQAQLNRLRVDAHHLYEELERIAAYLKTHADPILEPLVSDALIVCKRLDQPLN